MSDLVYEVKRELATIGKGTGIEKRLTLVSWNGYSPKLDLRIWRANSKGEYKPNKGLTLTRREAEELVRALDAYLAENPADNADNRGRKGLPESEG